MARWHTMMRLPEFSLENLQISIFMSDKVHHPYSPSTLQSLEACPCYRNHETTTNERAIAGTLAHAVIENRQDDARLSDEDSEAAAECLDFYDGRVRIFQEERRLASERIPAEAVEDIIELRETYLPIDECKFDDAQSTTAGYVDRAVISHDRRYAELYDWKLGYWPVETADRNLQGIAYTLGLFKMYPTLERVRFFFKLPHQDSVTDAVFTRAHIPDLYLRVQTVVARARDARKADDFATARPAVPVCNFCANIGRCPKVAEFSCKVGSKFYPLEIPSDITPTAIHTNRDTSLGLRLASVLAIWSEAFRRQTTDRVLRGDADMPAGHKLESRSNRTIADNAKFKEVSLKFVSSEDYDSLLDPPGFGKIEEMITERSPRGQKKAALESFKTTLEESGAVVKGRPYCFLKSVAETNTTNKQ